MISKLMSHPYSFGRLPVSEFPCKNLKRIISTCNQRLCFPEAVNPNVKGRKAELLPHMVLRRARKLQVVGRGPESSLYSKRLKKAMTKEQLVDALL